MEKQHLHIIAINIPYPPNYGGIIDIYYKVKALHELGVGVILHCFEYERGHAQELEEICEKVYYYKRNTGLLANLSLLPYNVYSRKVPGLIDNLLADEYPVLFEGLHTCYYIDDPRLKKRMKIFRECNIEHDYYHYLALSCNQLIKKTFFHIEAWRFKRYQKIVKHADLIASVSKADQQYLQNEFPETAIEFIPCFHANDTITVQPGKSTFILYHAKLSVFENERAAIYLIKNVFNALSCPCIIAGMDPSAQLIKEAAPYPHIRIIANPPEKQMKELIRDAQIHLLITFQDTGLKLKLLNSLFAGRHTIVNNLMLAGSGLESLCHIADTPQQMIRCCNNLIDKEFTIEEIEKRTSLLIPFFSNSYQAKRLHSMIYEKE